MKINFTKKQYKELITMSGIANSILGILGDELEGSEYKKQAKEMDELESYLLEYASEFGCDDLTQEFEGRKVFNDDVYMDALMPIITDYDELAVFNELSNILAVRDFHRDHTEEEIKKMTEESSGYLGVPMYEYEKKYWDEFEEYGYNRLEIDEDLKTI